ncbi:Chaperone protein DnaJ, partial [Diplonema papillatum]
DFEQERKSCSYTSPRPPLSSPRLMIRRRWLHVIVVISAFVSFGHAERELYSVLGLPRGSDVKAVKSAYKKLAMKLHPDHNPEPEAKERFQEVQQAYNVLSDDAKKENYDRFGSASGPRPSSFYFQEPIKSSTVRLGKFNWADEVRDDTIWVVWYYIDDLNQCRNFASSYDGLADSFKGIARFGRVNIRDDQVFVGLHIDPHTVIIYYYGTAVPVNAARRGHAMSITTGDIVAAFVEHYETAVYIDEKSMLPHAPGVPQTIRNYNTHVELVDDGSMAAFLASDHHLVKAVYFVAKQGEIHQTTLAGVPLDLIRLQMTFRSYVKFAVARTEDAPLAMNTWGIMNWGRALIIVHEDGSHATKTGGLRPFSSVARFVDANKLNPVPKLTRFTRHFCQYGATSSLPENPDNQFDRPADPQPAICLVLAFLPSTDSNFLNTSAYKQAFATAAPTDGSSARKLWLTAKAQPEFLAAMDMYSIAPDDLAAGEAEGQTADDSHAVLIAFSTRSVRVKPKHLLLRNPEDFQRSRYRLWVEETLGAMGGDDVNGYRVKPFEFALLPDGEDGDWWRTTGKRIRYWVNAMREFEVPYQLFFFVGAILFLYYRNPSATPPARGPSANPTHRPHIPSDNDRARTARSRYPGPTPQPPPNFSPGANPTTTQSTKFNFLTPVALTESVKWNLLCLVPTPEVCRMIQVPPKLMLDGKLMLTYMPEDCSKAAAWYRLFGAERGKVTAVALRGSRRKWCVLCPPQTRVPSHQQLTNAVENLFSGNISTTLAGEWPPL